MPTQTSGLAAALSPDLLDLADRLGDPTLVPLVVGAYLEALPQRLAEIEHAGTAPDAVAVRAVHSLRSASALLGLGPLAEACGALEHAWRRTPPLPVPELLDTVLDLADQVRRQLREAATGPSPS